MGTKRIDRHTCDSCGATHESGVALPVSVATTAPSVVVPAHWRLLSLGANEASPVHQSMLLCGDCDWTLTHRNRTGIRNLKMMEQAAARGERLTTANAAMLTGHVTRAQQQRVTILLDSCQEMPKRGHEARVVFTDPDPEF